MEKYDVLKSNIIAIENGDVEMPDRIDGIFIGKKEKLFRYILKENSIRYVIFKSFLKAMKDITKYISPVSEQEKDVFFIDLAKEKNNVLKILLEVECFDYIFFFNDKDKCIFYANDNLEDVTIII